MLAEALRPRSEGDHKELDWPFTYERDADGRPRFNDQEVLHRLRKQLCGPVTAARHAGFHLQAVARAHDPKKEPDGASNWAMDALIRIVALSLAFRVLPEAGRAITRNLMGS